MRFLINAFLGTNQSVKEKNSKKKKMKLFILLMRSCNEKMLLEIESERGRGVEWEKKVKNKKRGKERALKSLPFLDFAVSMSCLMTFFLTYMHSFILFILFVTCLLIRMQWKIFIILARLYGDPRSFEGIETCYAASSYQKIFRNMDKTMRSVYANLPCGEVAIFPRASSNVQACYMD